MHVSECLIPYFCGCEIHLQHVLHKVILTNAGNRAGGRVSIEEMRHHTCLQKCGHTVTDIEELLNVDEHACMTVKQCVGQLKAVCLQAVLSCVHKRSPNLLLCTAPCS